MEAQRISKTQNLPGFADSTLPFTQTWGPRTLEDNQGAPPQGRIFGGHSQRQATVTIPRITVTPGR